MGAVIVPIYFGAAALVGGNAAAMIGIGLILYFLNYEWFHFLYHTRPNHPLLKIRLVAAMRLHHAAHHQRSEMGKVNFNITYPFCDWLFGTYRAEPQVLEAAETESTETESTQRAQVRV